MVGGLLHLYFISVFIYTFIKKVNIREETRWLHHGEVASVIISFGHKTYKRPSPKTTHIPLNLGGYFISGFWCTSSNNRGSLKRISHFSK